MKFLRKIKYWIYILYLSLGNRFEVSREVNNFKKKYKFFMLNWWDEWVRFGINDYMKETLRFGKFR